MRIRTLEMKIVTRKMYRIYECVKCCTERMLLLN